MLLLFARSPGLRGNVELQVLKLNISYSESRGLDEQTHPCVEEFVHGLCRSLSANGSQPSWGPNRTLLIPLGTGGWILPSVTPVDTQHNSLVSSQLAWIHCEVTANGRWAPGWELGSVPEMPAWHWNRHEGTKPPPPPPCACALGWRADSSVCRPGPGHLSGRAFPPQVEREMLFWRAFK